MNGEKESKVKREGKDEGEEAREGGREDKRGCIPEPFSFT